MRAIPKTGERIPVVGLGAFETFDVTPGEPRQHIHEVLRRFHQAGGRVVDTSPLYGTSEASVGDFATELGIAGDLTITNKTWTTGEHLSDNSHSEAQFRRSMSGCGARPWTSNRCIDWRTMIRCCISCANGRRVRYIGATQWSPEYYDTLERLVRTGGLDFIQVNYSVGSAARLSAW